MINYPYKKIIKKISLNNLIKKILYILLINYNLRILHLKAGLFKIIKIKQQFLVITLNNIVKSLVLPKL